MKYKAFISYSHASDSDLAPSLEDGLEKFAKPTFKRRALKIFRDANDLSASPNLWNKITDGLLESEYFIFLGSQKAAQSKWCRKEVEFWKEHKSFNNFLIVITDGDLVWDETTNDFDWDKTSALPNNLANAFTGEPLYVDFRGDIGDYSMHNQVFKDKVVLLAATLHGRSIGDMVGESVRQYKKTLRYRNGAIAALSLLLLTACFLAYFSVLKANEATENASVALINENLAKEANIATQRQLLETKQKNYLVQSKAFEETNPLLALRYAEKGYELSKENNLNSIDLENQIIKIVYSGRLLPIKKPKNLIPDTIEKVGNAKSHNLIVEGDKIVEQDKNGRAIYSYTDQEGHLLWSNPFFSNNGKFVVSYCDPEGGEVAGSGFVLFNHKGKVVSNIYARHYSYPFKGCPYFFDREGAGILIFSEDHDLLSYPLEEGGVNMKRSYRLRSFGDKTSAIALSASGTKLVNASDYGKVIYYEKINLAISYYNKAEVEFVAHPNKQINKLAFYNQESVLSTSTATETKYWALNKKLYFQSKQNKQKQYIEPFTGELINVGEKFNRWSHHWATDTSDKYHLTNKSLTTHAGDVVIWIDEPNHDNDPYMGDISSDGRFLFSNDKIYPLDVDHILKLINEFNVLGELEDVQLDEG